jgi:ribosomal protein L37AE/L43A
MSTPQRRYEHAIDARMDADLAETIAAARCENCGRELVEKEEMNCAKCEQILEKKQTKNTMTTDTLFNIEPTKPTKLQAARLALADAVAEYDAALERCGGDDASLGDYERAVNRFAELVKAEELAELNNSKLAITTLEETKPQ